jgi:hypothetical protein
VTDQDEADVGIEHDLHDIDVLLAVDAEDVLDAFVLLAADEPLGDRGGIGHQLFPFGLGSDLNMW